MENALDPYLMVANFAKNQEVPMYDHSHAGHKTIT